MRVVVRGVGWGTRERVSRLGPHFPVFTGSPGLGGLVRGGRHSLPWEPEAPLTVAFPSPPEEAPVQKVSLARNSRYYLSCPMESRHATYWWRHGQKVEQRCEPGHQSPNCVLFIENLTDGHYGHYYCEAQEGSYLRKAQHWQLLSEDEAKAEHLLGNAHGHAHAASLWLGVLPTLTLGLLVH